MPESVATIKIVGKDQASPALKQVNRSIDELGRTARQSKASVDSLFGGLGGQLTVAAAGGLTLLARESIRAASNLEELTSKARFVFGDTFALVEERTRAMASEVGRANSSLLQFSADMGGVLDGLGLARPAMAEMSTGLAKLSVDMASFHNTTDLEAFQALRSAITGETEPMKRFGVVLTQANLSAYALSQGIRKNVQDMGQAELTSLRYNFILDRTATVQGDAARTSGSFANQSRRLKDEIKTLFEEMGKEALPTFSQGIAALNSFVANGLIPTFQKAIAITDGLKKNIVNTINLLSFGRSAAVTKDNFVVQDYTTDSFRARNEAMKAGNLQSADLMPEVAGGRPTPLGGGGGGGSGADEAKKTLEKLAATEKEIQQSLGEQAKLNQDRIRTLRDEYNLKRQLGTVTAAEERMLERINRRSEYQSEIVQEATRAWEEQAKSLESAEEKIRDVNDRILEHGKRLQEELAAVDKKAGEDRVATAARVIKEIEDVREKGSGSAGLSGDDSYRIGQLQDQLRGFDQGTLDEAGLRAGMGPAEQIAREAEERKRAIATEANERLDSLTAELQQAQVGRDQIRTLEEEKRQAVVDSLAARSAATESHYKVENDKLTAFVNTQVAEYARLTSGSKGSTSTGPAVQIGSIQVNSQADADALIRQITRTIQKQSSNAN